MSAPDLMLCALPKHGVNVPPLALPYLAGYARSQGFDVQTIDLNLDLWLRTRAQPEWHHVWTETDTTLFAEPAFGDFHERFFAPVLDEWAERLVAVGARYVGLSCFSYRSIPTLTELVGRLKRLRPEMRIIVGGAPVNTYAERFLDELGIDFAVKSEGELALVELLRGNFEYPGIVSRTRRRTEPVQIARLDDVSRPDYAGVTFDDYVPGDPGGIRALSAEPSRQRRRQAGIMASRGCVRACRFCDVASWWPKFYRRSPENIFAEVESLFYDHGVDEFYFHDSLINGSLTHLEGLLDLLIGARTRMPLRLKGLTIIRHQPERIYQRMAEAGFVQFQIGVETFSERLRRVMNKGFSNELLAENLKLYSRYGIEIILLLMSGYPGETEADHVANLRWIEEELAFRDNPVKRIDFGGTTLILPGAPLFRDKEREFFVDANGNWLTFDDEGANTYSLRVRRMLEGEQHAQRLGWRVGTSYSGGIHLIGDAERLTLKGRPQDTFRRLAFHDRPGWAQDPTRPIVGFQN